MIRITTMEYLVSDIDFKYIPAVPVELSGIQCIASQIYTIHLLIWHNLHSMKGLILLSLIFQLELDANSFPADIVCRIFLSNSVCHHLG